ncbi:hypothetical protein [Pseudomonas shirazensis]
MKKILPLIIIIFTLFSCTNDEITDPEIKNPDVENPDVVLPVVSYSIPDSLNFSAFNSKLILNIKNNGKAVINYNINSSDSSISFSLTSGDITAGNQSEIVVNANRNNLQIGKSYSKIFLTINNKIESIVVSVDTFKEQKTILPTDVVDAEYSKITDQLVYVSANPSRVNIFSSASETTETISLLYTPTCISISQDGKTAAVGHDGHITYVNLNNKSIINTYDVSCSANDIVLGNNKWAYVFPEQNQWTFIRCVNMNLPENNESIQSGSQIYAGTKGRLHPSGKYIYGANNGLSPSDIEKYNIQNGVAEYSYDSPYHGDYSMNGNLWFSEDGSRIFTRGKTVLKTSETKAQDMTYNGKINTDSNANIEWLDHSANKGNLYVILSNGDYWTNKRTPFVNVYNASNLNFKSKIELEKFAVPNNNGGGNFYDAEPYFVFSNSVGNNLFVLIKATGSGLDKEWGIQKITIE